MKLKLTVSLELACGDSKSGATYTGPGTGLVDAPPRDHQFLFEASMGASSLRAGVGLEVEGSAEEMTAVLGTAVEMARLDLERFLAASATRTVTTTPAAPAPTPDPPAPAPPTPAPIPWVPKAPPAPAPPAPADTTPPITPPGGLGNRVIAKPSSHQE